MNHSMRSMVGLGNEFIKDHKWLKFALIGVGFILASPVIGAAIFAAFAVVIAVMGWALYGIVAWIAGFMWVLSHLMAFPFMMDSPPTAAFVISILGGFGCHMLTLWILFETLDQI